jgi:hypothetical protein
MRGAPRGRLFRYPPAFGFPASSGAVAEPFAAGTRGADAAGATIVVPLESFGGTIARRVEVARAAAARRAGALRCAEAAGFAGDCAADEAAPPSGDFSATAGACDGAGAPADDVAD